MKGPAANSEYELFPDALERLEPYILSAMARVPAFGEVGVKKVYNGAIAYTPDGSPIVGPAWDKKNFWLNEGHSFGITAAGGAGWQLAQWIVEGEPSIDMMGVDPRRFGDYAGEGYLIEKNEEAYAKVFTVHYPDEEREAGRALRRTPCYDRMKALGAVFGSVFGWERPNWFAPEGYELTDADLDRPDVILNHNHPDVPGEPIREKWSFRRSNYFEHVGNECRHVTQHVGIQDMSAFAKCMISGPGAEDWLNGLLSNVVPKKIGRVTLSYLLTDAGRRARGVHGLQEGSAGVLSRLGGCAGAARSGLSAESAADRRFGTLRAADDGDGRAGRRRPEVARCAAEAHPQ